MVSSHIVIKMPTFTMYIRLILKENTSGVKEAIMEHGAVGVMYYHSDYNMSWSRKSDCYTYYDTARAGGGHLCYDSWME